MSGPSLIHNAKTAFGTVAGPLVFSGHESFACRYGWLPKFYEATLEDPLLFESPEKTIMRLGIGRNMVKSIRFWAEALGLAANERGRVKLTDLAKRILDTSSGIDPYLESHSTLWRLHWMLTVHGRLGAWAVGFLESHDHEIPREPFIRSVAARAAHVRGTVTLRTATDHVDAFLRTYAAPHRFEGPVEDAMGSPFQELDLIQTGTRVGQAILRFSRGPKRSLDLSAFAFAVHDFWRHTALGSTAVSLRSLMLSYCAPGAVFLLDEVGLHAKVQELCDVCKVLTLTPDGAGGLILSCERDPLPELHSLAWRS